MSLKDIQQVAWDAPLEEWPVYYKDGLPFIYDDDWLHINEYGEPMSQPKSHSDLAIYLQAVLVWQYRMMLCSVTYEISFRARVRRSGIGTPGRRRSYVEITPDAALVKGVQHDGKPTYRIGPANPAPAIAFEIGSPGTYREDLGRKYRLYAEVLRVQEYIVYDPHEKRLWQGPRLRGWRLVKGHYVALERDKRGWVWSEELESYLVEDGPTLRLYDAEGNRRLTEGEDHKQRAEQEQQRADHAVSRAEQEQQRAEQAESQVEQERRRADQLAARLQALEAQLRKLNPEAEA